MILAVLDCRYKLPQRSKTLQSDSMKPHRTNSAQGSFLLPDLASQLDPRQALYCLAMAID
jgi:hypothetical protein